MAWSLFSLLRFVMLLLVMSCKLVNFEWIFLQSDKVVFFSKLFLEILVQMVYCMFFEMQFFRKGNSFCLFCFCYLLMVIFLFFILEFRIICFVLKCCSQVLNIVGCFMVMVLLVICFVLFLKVIWRFLFDFSLLLKLMWRLVFVVSVFSILQLMICLVLVLLRFIRCRCCRLCVL